MAKAELLRRGSASVHNSWSSAMQAYRRIARERGKYFTQAEVVFDIYYIADKDDPYANNLSNYDLYDADIAGTTEGQRWTIKSMTPDKFGDLGPLAGLDSVQNGKGLSGMQNAVIVVNQKALWRNSNQQEVLHRSHIDPMSADVLNTLMIHMGKTGINLMPAGERVVRIKVTPDSNLVIANNVRTELTEDGEVLTPTIKVWRDEHNFVLKKEMQVKRYLTNRYGGNWQAASADKTLNKTLRQIYPEVSPSSLRRVLVEWKDATSGYQREGRKGKGKGK